MRLRLRIWESAYAVGAYVPYRFKQHALTVLNIPISILSIFNANMIKHQYDGKTIYFKYTDAISLLYFLFSVKRKTVKEMPLKIFDLPDYFDAGIDIGAHFGSVAIPLGAFNDIELFCFEPNEYNIGILKKNFALV